MTCMCALNRFEGVHHAIQAALSSHDLLPAARLPLFPISLVRAAWPCLDTYSPISLSYRSLSDSYRSRYFCCGREQEGVGSWAVALQKTHSSIECKSKHVRLPSCLPRWCRSTCVPGPWLAHGVQHCFLLHTAPARLLCAPDKTRRKGWKVSWEVQGPAPSCPLWRRRLDQPVSGSCVQLTPLAWWQ